MLFGGPCTRPFPLYFMQYLHPVGLFFFSLLSFHPLFVRIWALRGVVRFIQTGGDSDRELEGEGERQLCLCYFPFCFTPPSSGCWSLAVRGCGGVSALFGDVRIVLWLRLFLHELF